MAFRMNFDQMVDLSSWPMPPGDSFTNGECTTLSSVVFPHSNCRVEIGVKTIKRLITGNIGKEGSLEVDNFQKAILQYRNTPDPTTKMSPAMFVFGRPVKDLIPILPGKFHPHPTWRESLQLWEQALRHRGMRPHSNSLLYWFTSELRTPHIKVNFRGPFGVCYREVPLYTNLSFLPPNESISVTIDWHLQLPLLLSLFAGSASSCISRTFPYLQQCQFADSTYCPIVRPFPAIPSGSKSGRKELSGHSVPHSPSWLAAKTTPTFGKGSMPKNWTDNHPSSTPSWKTWNRSNDPSWGYFRSACLRCTANSFPTC